MSYVPNIKTFVRVYDLGSMSAAGRDLRISAAVTSSRIADLERHLGVRLFNRTTRSLSPTEQGELFYKGAIRILDMIEEVEGSIADVTDSPKGTVFVAAPLGLGKKLIAPLVPSFKENYPDVNVRLRLSDRKVDFTAEGLDAAFVLGELKDSEMRVRPVHEFKRVLCASPAYLERQGAPTSPEDLPNHHCLLLRFPGAEEFFWTLQVNGRRQRYDFSSPMESDDGDVLTGWAVDGCGIVSKTRFEVSEQLEDGRLVEVLPDTPPTSIPFSCVFPHKRLQDPKTRLLIDHMIEGCQKQLG
ncbi:LysR family transcriptional regulator [Ahrensia sp. R2A130]|uniref:LysR family transcriptional regulator n=1 Tax=Ahrensia sp. R2A130 TaxID=744979 RepID=UPI0005909E5D|nr:LysR family transcriptional regulator [Ahrensia sp. R2A130]